MHQMESAFEQKLRETFSSIKFTSKTEVRWWMAAGMHTDETIRQELTAMYQAGFCGVELCQLADRDIDETVYGYGGAQWENDVKLILNTALDLGMTVSLTSGAGWSTANVPGLDPDSQQANQCIVLLTEEIGAGCSRSGYLPEAGNLREKSVFIGAAALRKAGENTYDPGSVIVLTESVSDSSLVWTAPDDGDYTIMYYYAQGTAQAASPAVKKSYTINYFDRRGVEALKQYLETNVLNDELLNQKIRAGNVQYFMDSLEYHKGAGITIWTETFAEEFRRRKGYDILPFMFLASGAPNTSIWDWSDNADLQGKYSLTDSGMNKRILNDIFDVQTKLYLEEFIQPFRKWLNSRGITLRAQISYGKELEISEPIGSVDYPEAENRNQKNQIDMYRLWSGGAHLQNKILSAETGGLNDSNYNYTYQRHLQEAYSLYSAGYSRIIWHIWSSQYGPTPLWPGYEGGNGMDIFYKFGTREPSSSDYSMFNNHLGRIQELLRCGKAGVDLGLIYTKYGQHLVYGDEKDWMHTHQSMFFPTTALQDNGYIYDYLSPSLLDAEGVYFCKETGTLELAGYKALILWQNVLSVAGAKRILAFARDGLPVVVVNGAAAGPVYQGDSNAELAGIMDQLKMLPNVRSAGCADDVLDVLQDMGITPYVGFAAENQQILTQTRRDGKNRYIFAYNYCDGSHHNETNRPHGDSIITELSAEGTFVPYYIDPWTGKTGRISARYENGRTWIPLSLTYGDTALFALEFTENCQNYSAPAVKELPSREITGWELTVESWSPSDEVDARTETLLGVETAEYARRTDKRKISVTLDRLATWDKIETIGKTVSGKGFYRASFPWNGEGDGAYLDFGKVIQSMRVKINGYPTEPVNMNIPRADITDLLRMGENTIEIEYSSNLNNIQLSRGKLQEGRTVNRFVGYLTRYESYGPSKSAIVPYIISK